MTVTSVLLSPNIIRWDLLSFNAKKLSKNYLTITELSSSNCLIIVSRSGWLEGYPEEQKTMTTQRSVESRDKTTVCLKLHATSPPWN